MPKLPGKFDDISKAATSVLNDDLNGCQKSSFVSKAKTGALGGGSAEVNTAIAAPKDGSAATPAKLTFKFSTPCSLLPGFSIDKLELQKEGKCTLETSCASSLLKVDGLKVDVKAKEFAFTDPLTATNALAFGCTYTGMKDHAVKVDTTLAKIAEPTIETLHIAGPAVVGLQFKNPAANPIPNVGVNYQHGDIFVAGFGKSGFTEFNASLQYKVSDDVALAANYNTEKKTAGWSLGGSARLSSDLTAKAKVQDEKDKMTLLVSFKKAFAKGTTVNLGMSYDVESSTPSFGLQAKVE